MTIAAGFNCSDGIILCADQQVSIQGQHKFYSNKVFAHSVAPDTAVAFTFSGNPELMKMFFGKFKDSVALFKSSFDALKLQNLIETVLSLMDVVDTDPDGLDMICALSVSNALRMVRTQRKAVREADRYEFVGCGDTSVLRYLSPLVTRYREFKTGAAIYVAAFLVMQAKRWIDGCSGETHGVIVVPQGKATHFLELYNMEQMLLRLEHLLGNLSSSFFYPNDTDAEFEDTITRLARSLRSEREQIMQSVARRSAGQQ